MSENKNVLPPEWDDPDLPELTDEILDHAELRIGGQVVREATGYLTKDGVKLGRPPLREEAKRQVTLRLDTDVIAQFKEGGPGWQSRINGALRKAIGLG